MKMRIGKIFIIVIFYAFFSLPSKAEEIIIKCVGDNDTTVYKWKKTFYGATNVFYRKKGEWLKWCSSYQEDGYTQNSTVKYLKTGAQCLSTASIKGDNGEVVRVTTESYIDFEFFKREHYAKYTIKSADGKITKNDKTHKYVCKKY